MPIQGRSWKSALCTERRLASGTLVLALAAFVAGCGKSSANAPSGSPAAMPVQVRIATSAKIPETTEYLSILKSRHSAAINPQVEGQITKILVQSGDRVRAGTPLLQIDPLKQEATVSSQEASRLAQEANVRYAKISLERAQKLFDAGVVSKQDLDNAQTAYDAALAQLKAGNIHALYGQSRVRAEDVLPRTGTRIEEVTFPEEIESLLVKVKPLALSVWPRWPAAIWCPSCGSRRWRTASCVSGCGGGRTWSGCVPRR